MLTSVVIVVLALIATAFYSYVNEHCPIDPAAVHLAPQPKLEGVYARNTLLENVEKLGEGNLVWPEDLVLGPDGKFLYVSCAGSGWIKKLHLADHSVEDWQHVGGVPLGLALGPDGEVLVADALQGLVKVTDEGVEVLASEVDGSKITFADGVAVDRDGLIYLSDVSFKYNVSAHWFEFWEGKPNGRLIVYDPKAKSSRLLLDNIYSPTGLTLTKDEDALIFTENVVARITKYYVKGDKKGTMEIMNENLPGHPDNIHYNYDEGVYYVGIVGQRSALFDLIWKTPFLKKLVMVLPEAVRLSLDAAARTARLLIIDDSGRALRQYQDPDAKAVGIVTGGIKVGDYLYVSSMKETFVGRIKL